MITYVLRGGGGGGEMPWGGVRWCGVGEVAWGGVVRWHGVG